LKILASAHDAGAANLLIHKLMTDERVDFVITGPAVGLATALGVDFRQSIDLMEIDGYDKVYVGSNSSFQLSDQILSHALSINIPTVGILDHWVNYQSRWTVLPQWIEVQDWRAFFGALFYFGPRVRLKHNYYLDYLCSNYPSVSENENTLLVILQPLSASFEHGNECFCPSISRMLSKKKSITRVILREHATTPASSCLEFLISERNIEVIRSGLLTPLWFDLSLSTAVLGFDSYALYIASKLHKNVYSIDRKRRSWFAPKYVTLH
jgi:hypothetical protein